MNVVVFDTPELTTSVRVSQDGDINLPVLGLMSVSGLNTMLMLLVQDRKRSCGRVTSFLIRMSPSLSWNMHLKGCNRDG